MQDGLKMLLIQLDLIESTEIISPAVENIALLNYAGWVENVVDST